jgi:co-chaperonin GroES (HSP10)
MRVRLLRGQVVVREDTSVHERRGTIIVPNVSNIDNRNAVGRTRKWHIGEVLGLGPPALAHGHEVAHGFKVGDRVLFNWTHNEKGFTHEWPEDGKPACWIPQVNVSAVLESA